MKSNLLVILTSGLILFLELSLIRFLPAHILYFGFFTNFVLLASFFGIGLGFLLGKNKFNLINFFPFFLLLLIALVKIFSIGVGIESSEIIFFKGDSDAQPLSPPSFVLLPLLYLVITATFASLSQSLARLFIESKKPVKTYLFDILGSILGILSFYLLSYLLSFPPPVWYSFFSLLFLPLVIKKKAIFFLSTVLLLITISLSFDQSLGKVYWSPYTKLTLFLGQNGGNLLSNNIHHQFFSNLKGSQFYLAIFSELKRMVVLDDVLIIGAGTGQDVQAALTFGAKRIDAVDIDPKIQEIGKNYHPEKPYQNSRVNMINDDGRHYLRTTNKKYDLIILALTDSLVVNASLGEIRLESYLFTADSFADAKSRLKKNGAFVMYNNYRKEWLINRLEQMLTQVFGNAPDRVSFTEGVGALLIAKQTDFQPNPSQFKNIPTDNWPFLYLKVPSIPIFYIQILSVVLFLSSVVLALAIQFSNSRSKFQFSRLAIFFFLGAAFSLIETKSIVQLNLLFGATWMVNVIAFIGILLVVLLACLFTLKWKINSLWLVILLIFLSLLVQYFVPLSSLLALNPAVRFLTAIPFFFAPIFFANLFFTNLFQDSQNAELDFGSNLLGLVFGGMVEYFALIAGYSNLAIIAGIFYLVVASFYLKISRR